MKTFDSSNRITYAQQKLLALVEARQRGAESPERRHQPAVVKRYPVITHRNQCKNDDTRKRHAQHGDARADETRRLASDIDRRMPRHDARDHLEERQLVRQLALLRPLELPRERLVRHRNDRIPAPDDKERNGEHLIKEANQLSHDAEIISQSGTVP